MFNVQDFGAAGIATPSETLRLSFFRFKWLDYPSDTEAVIYHPQPGVPYDSIGIQKAIDAAHSAGGGCVIVPPGDYLIGPIVLKSRVHLHLEAGARLWASPFIADYACPPGAVCPAFSHENGFYRDSDDMNRKQRLISAIEADDVSITGLGQISAQSCAFVIPWMNTRPRHGGGLKRPSDTFVFHACRHVRLEGIRILDTPTWSVVFDRCDHVRVHGVTLRAFNVINSDGIDLVDTSNVIISDCDIHATDDSICLKNTVRDRTMRNIVVTNCLLRTLCNAIKIGTDTAGNFEDITISNIVIANPDGDIRGGKGINLSAIDGGYVRNVTITGVVMRNVSCAFYLVGGCRTVQQRDYPCPRPGRMSGISLSHIRAEGTRYTSFIVGHPDQPIGDIHLSDVVIHKAHDFYSDPPPLPVPERPEGYPAPYMFGSLEEGDQLPAYGLYLRHVQGLVVRDFHIHSSGKDVRSPLVQDQCGDVDISGFRSFTF